ncbi:aldose sugar dehydrogenase YliI [Candidatus Phycosocius bacilliformis]|uniref:Aldose sugar dehydrogenase YliI n=1 Tax=Candidatus Phycosocius bacilliformis TaxID=1445552 RepID=A0A2P2EAS2_9PROT|nr:PQQ-dependent sugar dehydrogenase [Candidatus Phycosocius bacilliformis]GBF58166.1 aldose sugar dehydrogenase YliI [Candidatus Phycosocius bacilliformis]
MQGRIRHHTGLGWAACLGLSVLSGPVTAQDTGRAPTAIVAPGPTPVTRALSLPASSQVRSQVVVSDLEAPWGLAFLPNGDMLVTELLGQLRYVKGGANPVLEAEPIAGLPKVTAAGQGGLMDVTIHPDFSRNQLIYLSFSVGDEAANHTRVIRARLEGRTLVDVQTIFDVSPAKPRFQHFGSRFAWLPDKTLLISIGDGGNPPTSLDGAFIRQQAQKLDSHLGKIIRIHDDGRIPSDNPFVTTPGARPEIYSYGHRNAQGLARDPVTGRIYATEHGSQGGDELNQIEAGANYGWPKVTYGVEYGAARTLISAEQTAPGLRDPLAVWSPAIAPSGLTVVRKSAFKAWEGDVLAGGLRLDQGRGALIRIDLDRAGKVVGQERIDLGEVRVRDVRIGPDGQIYVLTTAMRNFRDKGQRNGQLWRLSPAD